MSLRGATWMLARPMSNVFSSQSPYGALGTAASFGTHVLRRFWICSRVENPKFSIEGMKALLRQVFSEPLLKRGNSDKPQ